MQPIVVGNLKSKFGAGGVDFIEEHLQSTGVAGGIGLVTNQEYKQRKERVELTIAEEEQKLLMAAKKEISNRRLLKQDSKQQPKAVALSFADDEQLEPPVAKRKFLGKNPDVNTQFLQDTERAEQAVALKRKIIEEYFETQQQQRSAKITTQYQYWDGSHSGESLTVTKGTSIA